MRKSNTITSTKLTRCAPWRGARRIGIRPNGLRALKRNTAPLARPSGQITLSNGRPGRRLLELYLMALVSLEGEGERLP